MGGEVADGALSSAKEVVAVPNQLISPIWKEAKLLISLAIPSIIIQLSFVVPPFLAASHVGRKYGYLYLDGYTLAWGTGNLATMALLQGVFNASDTLSPQAFGSDNFREVGLIAIRTFVVSMIVILPINAVLIPFMERMFDFLGQDPKASLYACQFYAVYVWSFPFYSLYSILWKFLAAQSIMAPMVVSTLVSTLVVLPLALEALTGLFGFIGVALSFSLFYISNSLIVILWLWYSKSNRTGTWPGLSAWQEALAWKKFKAFMILSVGGMLAYLEWAYWEILTLIIGTFGALPLSAHTVPRQVSDMGYILPISIGLALAIRLGATISRNVLHARLLTVTTLLVGFFLFGSIAIAAYFCRGSMIGYFTQEAEVVKICNEIWLNACLYFFFSSIFGINLGISIGLAMQWTFGVVTVICMWLIGMPTTYYFAVVRKGGLSAVWACIWPPYLLINLCMCVLFMMKDWDSVSKQIRLERVGLDKKENDVEAFTLVQEYGDEGKASHPLNGYGGYKRK
mmetsp:Transcript_6276/g.8163  ORF Transcript_6276/g.8163 Transcript_6276/m.8163 type:complete len:512 (-) Transcript_6276:259-1794(-)